MSGEEREHVRIVREPDLRRVTAAARAVLADLDRLRAVLGHRPDILAHLYAGRAISADDDHGRSRELVVQADELRWTELEQLVRVVEPLLDTERHAGVGTWHSDCPECEAVLAIGRIRAREHYRTVGSGAVLHADQAGDLSDDAGTGGSGAPADDGPVSDREPPGAAGTASLDHRPP